MAGIKDMITREPLVPFLVLGVALHFALRAVEPAARPETIEVPAETIRALVEQSEQLAGRSLTAVEIEDTVQGYVDDEVLLREARARGYDRDDLRVRKRLLNVMRTALDEPAADPSTAQLEAYYRENTERLTSPPSLTIEHVYFVWGSAATPDDAEAFIAALEASDDPLAMGEAFMGGNRMPKADRGRLVLYFGPEFADAAPELAVGRWNGPVESRAGVHYVRVVEHHAPELLPFEQIEDYLRQEWLFNERSTRMQASIDALRAKYEVILPEAYRAAGGDP